MPVRKIPKNYLSVTGAFASRTNGRALAYESRLEMDHMVTLDWDPEVESFEEQPVRILFVGKNGRNSSYVPDLLIRYRPSTSGKLRKPVLVEVKSQGDLEKNKDKYAPKFAAAKKFAAERGWEFRVITDREIRTPRLPNLKFLREYRLIEPDVAVIKRVVAAIRTKGGKAEVQALLEETFRSDTERLRLLPVIWHLVATGILQVDLEQPVTNSAVLVLPKRKGRQ